MYSRNWHQTAVAAAAAVYLIINWEAEYLIDFVGGMGVLRMSREFVCVWVKKKNNKIILSHSVKWFWFLTDKHAKKMNKKCFSLFISLPNFHIFTNRNEKNKQTAEDVHSGTLTQAALGIFFFF